MAKPVRLTPKRDGNSWRLSIPPKLSPTGKRQNLLYRTQEIALKAAKKLRKEKDDFGNQARAISPTLSEQATAAHALLKPFGITILEAAERIASVEREKAASISVDEALKAYLIAKDGLSYKQKQAIGNMAKHLRNSFSERIMATISGAEIENHIDSYTDGPSSFNAKVRVHVTFWRWCAHPKRGWCKEDALKIIDPKVETPNDTETLTASQAQALMYAAENHLPDCVVPFAIALYTGMRPAEIKRLVPDDITAEGITVSPVNDRKNKRRRFIQMPEVFAAWLAAYPIHDQVCPPNFFRKEKAVRRLAGFKVWSDYVASMNLDPPHAAKPDPGALPWPHNALRHTAASVAVALEKPLSILLFEHGHSGGEDTLRKHYLGKMTKKDANAIWALRPKNKNP